MTPDVLKQILIGDLRKNPFNARKTFDPAEADEDQLKLRDMAESIKNDGIVQPIILRKASDGTFQAAAGERRWMAAQIAGLKEVPGIVRDLDDAAMRRYAILENVHRLNLNEQEKEEAFGTTCETDYPKAYRAIRERQQGNGGGGNHAGPTSDGLGSDEPPIGGAANDSALLRRGPLVPADKWQQPRHQGLVGKGDCGCGLDYEGKPERGGGASRD